MFGDIHKKEKCFTKKYGHVLAKKCHSMSVYKICKHLHLDDVSFQAVISGIKWLVDNRNFSYYACGVTVAFTITVLLIREACYSRTTFIFLLSDSQLKPSPAEEESL